MALIDLFILLLYTTLAYVGLYWLATRQGQGYYQPRLLQSWIKATGPQQHRSYAFWYRYARLAGRSRRVWQIGFRRFQQKFSRTLPDQVYQLGLAGDFVLSTWRGLAFIYKTKRAVRRCGHKQLAHGV